jgi:hypothetical protein
MITSNKLGGRTVELFIPFEHAGKRIDSITFGPFMLGHVLLWAEGHWASQFELMVELAGVDEAVMRQLRYPDADRVMEAFFAVITPEVRNAIAEGRIPLPQEPVAEAEAEVKTTNGSGQPIAPGAPMPPPPPFETHESAFDLSEEP